MAQDTLTAAHKLLSPTHNHTALLSTALSKKLHGWHKHIVTESIMSLDTPKQKEKQRRAEECQVFDLGQTRAGRWASIRVNICLGSSAFKKTREIMFSRISLRETIMTGKRDSHHGGGLNEEERTSSRRKKVFNQNKQWFTLTHTHKKRHTQTGLNAWARKNRTHSQVLNVTHSHTQCVCEESTLFVVSGLSS